MDSLMRWALLCTVVLLGACTTAGHEVRHRYWEHKDGFERLPAADVIAEPGYISYPLLFARKQFFAEVSEGCDDYPLDVRVRMSRTPSPGPGLALPWIFVSGSSVFLIPYRQQSHVVAEFVVAKDGAPLRTFRYEDTKSTWLSFFGFLAMGKANDEYYVEERMADQFVNSFILDLLKDDELMAKLRSTPAVAAVSPSSGAPAAGKALTQ